MGSLHRLGTALVWCLAAGCAEREQPRAMAPPPPGAPAARAPPAPPPAPPPAKAAATATRAKGAGDRARSMLEALPAPVLGVMGKSGGGVSLEDALSAPPARRPAAGAEAPREEWPELQGIPVPTTRKLLGSAPADSKTLGDVARFITAALEQHQYEEMGFFRYSDGFAIATRPERIAKDASSLAERRWPAARVHPGQAAQSLQELFEVNGEEGDRYRSFVFVCQASGSAVGLSGGAQQTWGLWKTGSANPEGDALLARPLHGHKLYAFIYELSQDKGGRVLVATASPNTAAQHLRAAGLAAFLR